MEHARHVFRVLLVLFVVLVSFVIGRSFLVPKTFGMYGNYRYDNVAEQMRARAPLHGGAKACAECHEDRSAALAKGGHRRVSCEVCHGALGRHVQDGDVVAKPALDRSPRLCGHCHRKIDGRPASFPQVVFEKHVQGPLGERGCVECHDPHSPTL